MKLLELTRLLSPTSFRKLGKMVKSPYFTSNEHLIKLYQLLKPHYPDFQSTSLEKQKIFQRIFPKYHYSDIKLRNLLREMTKLVEELLLSEKLLEDQWTKKFALLELYLERESEKLFLQEGRKLKEELEQEVFKDEYYFRRKYQFHLLQLQYIQSRDLQERHRLLQESKTDLEAGYELEKLKLEVDEANLNKIYVLNEKTRKHNVINQPKYQLFQKLLDLCKENKPDIFFEAKSYLLSNQAELRVTSKKDALTFLINYAIRQMSIDDKKFNTAVFELYCFGLEHQMLLNNNKMTDIAYINITVAAAKEEKFTWARKFTEDFKTNLAYASSEDCYQLAQAYLLFYEARFEEASAIVQHHQFTSRIKKISARAHQLRCSFELFLTTPSRIELLDSQSIAFEKFIRRNQQLTERKKKSYLNFILFIRKLIDIKLTPNPTKGTKQILLDKLDQTTYLLSRNWIKEKIRDI